LLADSWRSHHGENPSLSTKAPKAFQDKLSPILWNGASLAQRLWFTVFHLLEDTFCTSLVEKELTTGSAMIVKPPLALQKHVFRHDWCEANLALGT